MKRIVFVVSFIFILSFSTISTVFAAIKLDGSITPAELEDSNIQAQCENGNSGCGLHVLSTYYKLFPDSSKVYLAFNAELDGEQILADGPFGFKIYIEDYPVISIYTNNRAEFNSSYYDVKVSNRIDFSSMRCETSILFKNHIPDAPKIYVKVIDNDGIASKMFKINTVMPEVTTDTKDNTNKSTYKFTLPNVDVTKKTSEQSSQITGKTTNSQASAENNASIQQGIVENRQESSKMYANSGTKSEVPEELQHTENLTQYDLSSQTGNKDTSAAKKRNRLVLICAATVVVVLLGAATAGIKASSKKQK